MKRSKTAKVDPMVAMEEAAAEAKRKLLNETRRNLEVMVGSIRRFLGAEREYAKEQKVFSEALATLGRAKSSSHEAGLAREMEAFGLLQGGLTRRSEQLVEAVNSDLIGPLEVWLESEFNTLAAQRQTAIQQKGGQKAKKGKQKDSSKVNFDKNFDVVKKIEIDKEELFSKLQAEDGNRRLEAHMDDLQQKLFVEQMHFLCAYVEQQRYWMGEKMSDIDHLTKYIDELNDYIIQERDGLLQDEREQEDRAIEGWRSLERSKFEVVVEILCRSDLSVLNAVLDSIRDETVVQDVLQATVDVFEAYQRLGKLLKEFINDEVDSIEDIALLFRSNGTSIRLLLIYIKKIAEPFFNQMLAPLAESVLKKYGPVEIDPDRVGPEAAKANQKNLEGACEEILMCILKSGSKSPDGMRIVIHFLCNAIGKKFPKYQTVAVGGFIFLRFVCPCLLRLKSEFSWLEAGDRSLVLVSKVLQNLANGVFFRRDTSMAVMNPFLERFLEPLKDYVANVATLPAHTYGLKSTLAPNDVDDHLLMMYRIFSDNISSIMQKLVARKDLADAKKVVIELAEAVAGCGAVIAVANTDEFQEMKSKKDLRSGRNMMDMMGMEPPPIPPSPRDIGGIAEGRAAENVTSMYPYPYKQLSGRKPSSHAATWPEPGARSSSEFSFSSSARGNDLSAATSTTPKARRPSASESTSPSLGVKQSTQQSLSSGKAKRIVIRTSRAGSAGSGGSVAGAAAAAVAAVPTASSVLFSAPSIPLPTAALPSIPLAVPTSVPVPIAPPVTPFPMQLPPAVPSAEEKKAPAAGTGQTRYATVELMDGSEHQLEYGQNTSVGALWENLFPKKDPELERAGLFFNGKRLDWDFLLWTLEIDDNDMLVVMKC